MPQELKSYTLHLNQYQRDNLLWMFEVAKELRIFNNGDWFGEIPQMLGLEKSEPNQPLDVGIETTVWRIFHEQRKISSTHFSNGKGKSND